MGISGLLPFLENASRKCYINEFRGYTVAIDSYCWLHKGAFACAEKLVRGENTNIHILYCLKYIKLLLDYNIRPIMVFDGQHLPAKKLTESKRREQRKAARTRATELLRLGKTEEARQNFRKCVDITHDMALALIKECRKLNIDCIVAPYEADAQLAYLNLQGIAQIVITEDSDLVLFGCSKILFKFSLDGSASLVERDKLNLAMKMRPNEYNFDKFRYMCIISGCDYLDSLPGIGLKKAHKAVVMTHDPNIYNLLPRLPRYLNIRNLTVSKEYIENFKLADATLRHQIVFDPLKRELVRLTDTESTGFEPEHLKNAGEIYDNDKAFQMALGNIDPFSLKVKDDWNPDAAISSNNHSNSIWFREYKKPKSPPKIPKLSTARAKSTKNQTVTLSTENILREQEMYDNNLIEELKMYQTRQPPPKRQKINEDPVIEPQLNVKKTNPFIKNKQPKRLSKFGFTNLENKECVRSPFFASKSNTEENKVEQKTKENLDITIKDDEILLNTYSQDTIKEDSEEGSDNDKNVPASADINLKTFTFNKFKKLTNKPVSETNLLSANKEKVDSYNLSDLEEHESDLSHFGSDTSLELFPQNDTPNSEDDEDRTSPVLASSVIKRFDSNKQSSSLGMFQFNTLKKKISSGSLRKYSTDKDNSSEKLDCDKDSNIESDIENLTPKEEGSNENISINHENEEVSIIDEPKEIHHEVQSKTVLNRPFKRHDSCRPVGLSRNRKKAANQPTILSMFNKMTKKD